MSSLFLAIIDRPAVVVMFHASMFRHGRRRRRRQRRARSIRPATAGGCARVAVAVAVAPRGWAVGGAKVFVGSLAFTGAKVRLRVRARASERTQCDANNKAGRRAGGIERSRGRNSRRATVCCCCRWFGLRAQVGASGVHTASDKVAQLVWRRWESASSAFSSVRFGVVGLVQFNSVWFGSVSWTSTGEVGWEDD